jgi:hypothetical protein
MLHNREYCPECVKNLYCGYYLPVETSAAERQGQSIHPGPLMGVRHHFEPSRTESERDSVGPEVLCSAHKLLQVRNGIVYVIGEIDLELLEERDRNLRKKRFQVSTITFEPEPPEVRKCDARHDRRTQQLPLSLAGKMGVKIDSKYLQLRHE